jgi:hypothetical protein
MAHFKRDSISILMYLVVVFDLLFLNTDDMTGIGMPQFIIAVTKLCRIEWGP